MRPSIFSRLIIGFMAILLPVITVGIYAVFQLSQFNTITRSIIDIDNPIIDYERRLSDSFLSQMQYEGKYIIIKDDALYGQFLLAKKDFSQYFDKVSAIADTPNKRQLLLKIRESYNHYIALFDREREFIRANKAYPQSSYKREKEEAAERIMEGLKEVRRYAEQDIYKKIKRLEETGAKAQRVAVAMIGISLFFGIAISILITRSIAKPLAIMKKKTKAIVKGDFDGDLDISSPSEIKDLAQAFNHMCNKLNEMDKMKSDFFSLMAHELRTPLASIKEGTNLLLEGIGGEVTEKQQRLLQIIAEESNRLIELVNSLLELSKMEAGMISFNLIDSAIKPLIDKVIAEVEPLAMAKDIGLKVDIPKELPILKMDAERILQVLRNLIGNAIKFLPQGGHVTISAQPVDGGIKVSVTDTGPGIRKEDLTTIFDKFRQATIGSSNKIEGTGLGLAIVKHIINAHGGKVWAESELGHGSTFVFLLPA